MKDLYYLIAYEERIIETAINFFISQGYSVKNVIDEQEIGEKTLIYGDISKTLNHYKTLKDNPYYKISFIGFDNFHIQSSEIFHSRNHLTHYFEGSYYSNKEIEKLLSLIKYSKDNDKGLVVFESFGYKNSNSLDADMIIDTRPLPNAFWVDGLKDKCGLDEEVKNYVFGSSFAKTYLKKIEDYLRFYLENTEKKIKKGVVIGFACTGGQHRSVAVCEYFAKLFLNEYVIYIKHREMNK